MRYSRNFGQPGCFDIAPWPDRVQLIEAKYGGAWEQYRPCIVHDSYRLCYIRGPEGLLIGLAQELD